MNMEGNMLATAGKEKDIFLWDPRSGQKDKLLGHTNFILDVRFTKDRVDCKTNLLASCSEDKTARVWDCNGKIELACIHGGGRFTSVDFHPNNCDLLATSEGDGLLRVWQYNSTLLLMFCVILRLLKLTTLISPTHSS